MLSVDTIDKLARPIVARQEQINIYVLKKIAARIKEIGELNPSDINRLEQMLRNGSDVREINEMLAKLTNLQVRDIKEIIRQAAILDYAGVKAFYDYRNLPYIPFAKNVQLQRIQNAIAEQTANNYINLSRTRAFYTQNAAGKTVPTNITDTYNNAVDKAIQAVTTGQVNFQESMRNTIQELADSGLQTVDYASGYHRRLDSAVKMNILDGIRQLAIQMQDEIGKQIDADAKEITVVRNPAPDHAPVQGHVFTNEEFNKMQNVSDFQDVNGKQFEAMERAIGVWNCRHIAYSIILGVEKPNYTEEQLQKILDENEAGYTTKDGKHFTLYECRQYQRKVETQIRRYKDGQIAAKAAGDMELARKYQNKIDRKTQEYMLFSNNCGLRPELDRIRVAGYKRIKI